MASKPHPDWTEPQRQKFNAIQEATLIAIPYFGAEIPRLDNHTPEMLCDQLGVVKVARKVFEQVEDTLAERFKPFMETNELRGQKYVATRRPSVRTYLNQGKVKELIAEADQLGVDLENLLAGIKTGLIKIGPEAQLAEGQTNAGVFNTSGDVSALYVEAI